ncbi:MAG: hypothetical protein Q9183_007173 [Haloplaca sp. 2 TL-2023]
MIKAFSAAVGRDLPYEVAPRREGDVLDLTANPRRANKELGWKAARTLEDACADLWHWTENNPLGYRQSPPDDLLRRLEENRRNGTVAKAQVNGHYMATNGHGTNGHLSNGHLTRKGSVDDEGRANGTTKRIKLSSTGAILGSTESEVETRKR